MKLETIYSYLKILQQGSKSGRELTKLMSKGDINIRLHLDQLYDLGLVTINKEKRISSHRRLVRVFGLKPLGQYVYDKLYVIYSILEDTSI